MISSVDSPSSLTLSDGTSLSDIDAIIFATGWSKPEMSTLLGPNVRARLLPPPSYQKSLPPNLPVDQLQYKFAIPPGLTSLCVNNGTFAPGQLFFCFCFETLFFSDSDSDSRIYIDGLPILVELKALYVAGVWSGNIPLASEEERWKGSLEDYAWLKSMQKLFVVFSLLVSLLRWLIVFGSGTVTNGSMPYAKTALFYSDAIGSPLHSRLTWFSIESWRWWLSGNWKLGRLVMDGVMSPHAFRLGGRKAWDGAEDAIKEANGIPVVKQ